MSSYSEPVALPPPADTVSELAADQVTALYQANALGLVRLAYVLTGDAGVSEDIVQDAFYGLYRRWHHLSDPAKALPYVRSAVLNACRTRLRRKRPEVTCAAPAETQDPASAETIVIGHEQRRTVMAAIRTLPARQREVLVLRFYLDLSEAQIAAQMGIGQSTVRSSAHRAFAALGRKLKEMP
ncbi:MAG TPA: SigE family RNA polymerase sigma factor [Streptosporangiaceae bacterium]|nr:SigE family RNA polymerase sigma factor [Streptosporangiaceae bacterium]